MKNIYEIFDEYEKAETVDDKIAVLRNNDNYALRNVLQGTYNPNIRFCIKTIPEYKQSDSPPGMGYTSIHQELGRIYLFEEHNVHTNPNLSMKRRIEILQQMLEAMESREAEVFANMLLKTQNVEGLTYAVAKQAFPELF
jgi:hypothetical protein